MREIQFANRFKKEFRLAQKRGKNPNKLHELMRLFEYEITLPARYRDHQLKGEFKNFRECHIEPDWLLIYRLTTTSVIFEHTGSHADLFE